MDQTSLAEQVKKQAELYGVDPALACAVAEQESGWDCWAMRFEPDFLKRYVAPIEGLTATERIGRATSWGLFQTMGQAAREMGFQHKFLSMLCDPDIGISVGVRKLKACLDSVGGDVKKGLLRYNGGGNSYYPDQVMNRMPKYQGASI
jgi:soluble lytic murein transglycosylase-like protein